MANHRIGNCHTSHAQLLLACVAVDNQQAVDHSERLTVAILQGTLVSLALHRLSSTRSVTII